MEDNVRETASWTPRSVNKEGKEKRFQVPKQKFLWSSGEEDHGEAVFILTTYGGLQ